MPSHDPQQLLSRLDQASLALLEKASLFCIQQAQRSVASEHLLLQMLDGPGNELNRLLSQNGIDPLAWVRHLIEHISGLPRLQSGKPVFSENLFAWLAEATAYCDAPDADRITQRCLIKSLLHSRDLKQRLQLPNLHALKQAHIDTFFKGATEQVEIDMHSDHNDATLLMSADEVAQSTEQAMQATTSAHLEIAGYSELQQIGAGGMATVYRALHLGLQREVALKVLSPASSVGLNDDFVERFLREARIVARLNHPNIVQIYDVCQSDQLTYLAMELISGGELDERMGQGFSLAQTVDILQQVLLALQYAHDEGFVHRDIKPSNILLRDNGSVALTDFGIARAVTEDSGLTVAGSVLGTPRYMSPEQARGDSVDHRADLYSVGVLFFHMLEGNLPFIGDSALGTAMKHIIDPIPRLSPQWNNCQAFIDRAMAKEANARFQCGNDMIDAMQALRRQNAQS